MNNQLQAQLSQILAQIMISVGEVKDFSFAQLPDIAQQYIQYGIYSSIFYSVIAFLFFIAYVIGSYKVYKHMVREADFGFDGIFILFVPLGFIGVVSLWEFFDNIHSLILVLTAPKVWFILEIKNLLS